MKKVAKFLPCCSFVFALVAFILLMTTPAIKVTSTVLGHSNDEYISGIEGIFGGDLYDATWAGLVAWILLIVALVATCCMTLLPFLKVKNSNKIVALCACLTAVMLVIVGVFTFIEVSAFKGVNGDISISIGSTASISCSLGIGWMFSGIASCVAAALCCCSTLANIK